MTVRRPDAWLYSSARIANFVFNVSIWVASAIALACSEVPVVADAPDSAITTLAPAPNTAKTANARVVLSTARKSAVEPVLRPSSPAKIDHLKVRTMRGTVAASLFLCNHWGDCSS